MRYYVKILIGLLLSILLPCITLFTVTNVIIFGQYRESVSLSQLNRLRAIDSTNQLIFDNIEQGASRFSLDPYVQSLVDIRQLQQMPRDSKYMVGMRRAMAMLGELVSTNELFDSVYLYMDGSDYIVSSRESVVTLDRFADLAWMERYGRLRENRNGNRLLPSRNISSGYNTKAIDSFTMYDRTFLTYVYPITPFISNFNGALVFNIREDKLLSLYAQPHGQSSLAMFDEAGERLTGIGNLDELDMLRDQDWERILRHVEGPEQTERSYFFSRNGNSRYQCTFHHSSQYPYLLVSLDDMSVLTKKATRFQIISIAFLLFLIPFGALLIHWGSRRLYSPIGILAKELSSSGRLELSKDTKDDWPAISRAIDELLREDRRLFSDKDREKIKEASCLRILSGEDGEQDEEIHQILPFRKNLCILAWLSAPPAQTSDSNDSRLRLLIWLMEDTLSQTGMKATAIRYEGNAILILLSVKEDVDALEETLRARLTNLQHETATVMDQSITFAISSLVEEPVNVRLSLGQARNAMQYRFMRGPNTILLYDRIFNNLAYYQADERLQYLHHCLYHGKKEDMLQGMRDLVEDIKTRGSVSYTYTSQVLNQLVTWVAQFTMEKEIPLDELLGDNTILYQRLWQNPTLDDACRWLCSIVTLVMDYGDAPDRRSEYVKGILAFVQEHYHEGITIDNIADHMGISYSYLRKLFKEATGQNLSDHINTLRMNKAKQLLLETHYPVKEIVNLCGYGNNRSFLRAFTQQEGLSPSKYREQAQGTPPNSDRPPETFP